MKRFLLIIFLSSFTIAMQEKIKTTRRSIMQYKHSQALTEVGKARRALSAWITGCGASGIVLLCSIRKPYHIWRRVWSSIICTTFLGLSLKTHQSYKAMKLMELRADRYKKATRDDTLAQKLLQEISKTDVIIPQLKKN